MTLTSRDGTQFVWPDGGATVRGELVMGGGGLPDLQLDAGAGRDRRAGDRHGDGRAV